MSSCSGPGCTDPSHKTDEIVEHERTPGPGVAQSRGANAAYNKTPYETDVLYRSRGGAAYRADANGTLRRVDGPKLSKAERKAAKREAHLEMGRK